MTVYDITYELPDQISDNGKGAEEIETEANLYWLLKRLPKKERRVVEFYIQGYTQQEIAEKLGTNQMKISRMLKCLRNRKVC